jgi:hypothetical protein
MASHRPCPLSPEDLVAFSEKHVLYERIMLFNARSLIRGCNDELRAGGLSPSAKNLVETRKNVAVESYAIHLRTLIAFLHPGRVLEHDVIAEHYFSAGSQWTPPAKTKSLDDAFDQASKHIAHLTAKRTDDPAGKNWPDAWADDVDAVLREFATQARPHGRLHPKFLAAFGLAT